MPTITFGKSHTTFTVAITQDAPSRRRARFRPSRPPDTCMTLTPVTRFPTVCPQTAWPITEYTSHRFAFSTCPKPSTATDETCAHIHPEPSHLMARVEGPEPLLRPIVRDWRTALSAPSTAAPTKGPG